MAKQTELPIIEKGIMHLSGIDSAQIMQALAEKHKYDVFIDECKNGKTWGAEYVRMDAWVLQRTWSPICTTGYEIKVSRQDFEQDQKWGNYLDLCHYFYFVCPSGLIRGIDLPSDVGLMWMSKNGTLHVKRKATRHSPNPEKMNQLLIYALMSRSKIVANMNEIHKNEPVDRLQELRQVIERANERKDLAYFINGHIKQIYADMVKREEKIAQKNAYVDEFAQRLSKLGITWNPDANDWQERNKAYSEIDCLFKHISWSDLDDMKRLSVLLGNVVKEISVLRGDDE